MGEDFRLKWNDHHNVFFSTAEQLCNGDHLTDVTLSCGDKEFAAHKLVLSICSSYFNQLFAPRPNSENRRRRRHEDSAVIVYLKDVDPGHMELLMNYMYRGEINVEENELMGLLATAKSLQIKGLTEADAEEDDTKTTHQTFSDSASANAAPSRPGPKKRPAPKSSNSSGPSTSSSAAKKIKEIKEETLEIAPTMPVAEPFIEPEPSNEEDYLESEDPSEMIEGHDDYNLDTSQGESMAYEGDPNNPGVSTPFVASVLTCIYINCVVNRGEIFQN
jgi:hypothetical protein